MNLSNISYYALPIDYSQYAGLQDAYIDLCPNLTSYFNGMTRFFIIVGICIFVLSTIISWLPKINKNITKEANEKVSAFIFELYSAICIFYFVILWSFGL